MMKIQYCSDLHLEFLKNTYFLHSNKLVPKADILVLAGDILPFCKNTDTIQYFDFLSDNFKQTYWLPGNHEYYVSDVVRYHKYKANQIRHNVRVVKDEVVSINGVNLIFTTLWSKISIQNELIVKSRVSDFSVIKIDGDDFRPKHFNQLHNESLEFLTNALERNNNNKNIVITHHVPTLQNYYEEYKNSPINDAFAVNLDSFILNYQPEAWIYGHSHYNAPEFMIGKTHMLTNQLGYVDSNEHGSFRLDAVFEI